MSTIRPDGRHGCSKCGDPPFCLSCRRPAVIVSWEEYEAGGFDDVHTCGVPAAGLVLHCRGHKLDCRRCRDAAKAGPRARRPSRTPARKEPPP